MHQTYRYLKKGKREREMSVLALVGIFLVFPLGVAPEQANQVDALLDRLELIHKFNASQLMHFVVVGNGPLTDSEREEINSHSKNALIVRFNDENNFAYGDVTHVHVIRHPSWSSRKNGLEEWHIAPFSSWIPVNSKVKTIVYEAQYEEANEAPSDQVLFKSTCFDESCWVNGTKYGASTGAVVLSALNENSKVKNISVYAMNWNGSPDHLDFLFPEMVPLRCEKCTIHRTHTEDYGQGGTLTALSILGSIGIFGCFIFLYITDLEATAVYRYMFVRETPSLLTEERKRSEPVPSTVPSTVPPSQQPQQQQQQLPLLPG